MGGAIASSRNCALAQIIPDSTLGIGNSTVTSTDTVDQINGGATRGTNLFHSFKEFNVGEGRAAYFTNPPGIENILSRVTGTNPSNIEGTLGVSGGNANLFLLNPNGIIFGQNASLDIGGSFVASTARSLVFEDATIFSAAPDTPTAPLLTISTPIGLQYGSNAGDIGVQGSNLEANPGQTLALVGGNVNLEGGQLLAPGGRVQLGGVAGEGTVGLLASGTGLVLSFPDGVVRGDVSLSNGAVVDVTTGGGGSIAVHARNLTMTGDNTRLLAGIASGRGSVDAQAGDIEVNATEAINLAGSSIANLVFADAIGNGGNVNITTASLSLTDGASLSASTSGRGNAGSVNIVASDTVSFDGEGRDANKSAAASMVLTADAEGNGGNVNITTGSLSLTNGAFLSASTRGRGNAGSVNINARDTVSFDGEGRDGNPSGAFSSVSTEKAVGNGGNVKITTGSLSLTNGAFLSASTSGRGNAGSVNINVRDTVSFDGESRDGDKSGAFSMVSTEKAVGNGGNVNITTGSLSVTNGALLSASTKGRGSAGDVNINARDTVSFDGEGRHGNKSGAASMVSTADAEGNGGDVNITTGSLSLTNGAFLSASTRGRGSAGDVNINARDTVSFDGEGRNGNNSGAFSSVSTADAEGNGGNVNITTGSLSLTNGAFLSASTSGRGNAGSVNINARDTVSFDGEDRDGNRSGAFSMVSTADAEGNGGNVNITTGSLSLTNGALLSASTKGRGSAGDVNINARDTVSFDGEDRHGNDSGAFSSVSTADAEGNGGNVNITTGSLSLTNGAFLSASTSGRGNAGSVNINARDTVSFDGEGRDGNRSGAFSMVSTEKAVGNGGNVNITTGSLSLTNGALLSASTKGRGSAGDVNINARDTVSFDGEDRHGNNSGAFSSVSTADAEGNGGNVNITTGSLSLTNGAYVSASTSGRGNAGSVNINARDTVSFDGEGRHGNNSGAASMVSTEKAVGNGGNVNITTGSLSVTNGAFLSASTRGRGNAGSVNIVARDTVSFDGEGRHGNKSGAASMVSTGKAVGNGGNVNITTGSLSVTNGAFLSATTGGRGNAGNLNITANSVVLDNGILSAEIRSRFTSVEEGANINLKVEDLLILRNNSLISARALGDANGGNVTIDAGVVVALPLNGNHGSDIIASADRGNGGRINIEAQGIFRLAERRAIPGNGTNDIDASSEFGSAGEVEIIAFADPSQGLVNLPTQPVDTEVAQSCQAGGGQEQSRFVVTGRGGLPPNPREALSSDDVQVNWVPLTSGEENPSSLVVSKNPTNATPAPLVEAQGWVINTKGQVVLTAIAPNVTPHSSWQTPTNCSAPRSAARS
jgi:filamentous hemagglutinin family protein